MRFAAVFLEVRWSVPLPEESAILKHKAPIDRSFGGQTKRGSKVALSLLFDGMALSEILLDVLQSRTLALAELAHSFAQNSAQIRRLVNLERPRLQAARVLVRGLALVKDLEHIAALHSDLQMLRNLLLVIIVMLAYRVAYPLDARSLLLAAYLADRVQDPDRPCLGRLDLVHRVSVGGTDGADGGGDDDDDEVTASASSSCR
jgi:hypothetical protein